jgi:hypothetical protein
MPHSRRAPLFEIAGDKMLMAIGFVSNVACGESTSTQRH